MFSELEYRGAVIILALVGIFGIWLAYKESRAAKHPDPEPEEHFHIEQWNGHDWVVYRKSRSIYAMDYGLAHSPDCKCLKEKNDEH